MTVQVKFANFYIYAMKSVPVEPINVKRLLVCRRIFFLAYIYTLLATYLTAVESSHVFQIVLGAVRVCVSMQLQYC